MINVLLVEDQAIIRDGIKFIIERDSEIRVTGCAGNGQEALKFCRALQPDLVLMDIVMPICDGIEATRLIKEAYPEIKIIILTTFNDEKKAALAIKNGADGYILKDIEPEELLFTIKSTVKGLRVFHESAYGTIVGRMNPDNEIPAINAENGDLGLSTKEIEIIRRIVYGKSNKEISAMLNLSEGGVRNSISAILAKLNLKDRTQLAVYAIKNDLI